MCNCNVATNFRNTCWIKNKEYKRCPMLLRSILMRISEDYQLNTAIQNAGFESIKEYVMRTCDITNQDWEALRTLYLNSNICNAIKIQDSVPFQYSPEMENIHLRWLY